VAVKVIMPALGMAQDTGVILSWLKSEGDKVEQGEPLMEAETDKSTVEIEAPATGIVARILAKAGEEVPVGQVVALIAEPGEDVVSEPVEPDASAESGASANAGRPSGKRVRVSPVAKRLAEMYGIDLGEVPARENRIVKEDVMSLIESQKEKNRKALEGVPASPKARRLMKELGVSLGEVKGSGPNRAILVADVLAAAEEKKAAQGVEKHAVPEIKEGPEVRELPVSTVWRIMAERTTKSWTRIPHFYLVREMDVSRFVEWRQGALDRGDVNVTFSDLLVKVVALALRRFPRMNVTWEDGRLLEKDGVNVGLAVATEAGLVVPVMRNADKMGVAEIAAARKEIVDRAKQRRLRTAEIGGGSLTISNLGMYGIDVFGAIINAPEPAILAVGRIKERVVAVNGEIAIRPMMTMTLSCDHRAIDGALGALFLKVIAEMIEEPLSILD